jgi:putative ABC transport system permease protein
MISFRIAMHSLWRSRWVSAICGVAIGVGVSAAVTISTVLVVLSSDPMPDSSAQLFTLRLDALPKAYADYDHGDPSDSLTYPDAVEALALATPKAAAASAAASSLVGSEDSRKSLGLIQAHVRYISQNYLSLFGVHIIRGARWSDEDGSNGAMTAILSKSMADRLFAQVDPIGQQVDVDKRAFRVVGVAENWVPQPQFMNSADSGTFFGAADDIYIPLETAVRSSLDVESSSCWTPSEGRDWHTHEACSWLQVWLKLDSDSEKEQFQDRMSAYVAQQRQHGRFERTQAVSLYSLRQWLEHVHVVSSDLKLQGALAFAFFFACLINIVGLLSAKFSKRRNEMAVRRALGATRAQIFWQVIFEASTVGLVGSVVGAGLSWVGLMQVREGAEGYADLAHLNVPLLALSLALSLAGACLAGMLPAWRACRVLPALQLKEE